MGNVRRSIRCSSTGRESACNIEADYWMNTSNDRVEIDACSAIGDKVRITPRDSFLEPDVFLLSRPAVLMPSFYDRNPLKNVANFEND